MNLSHVTQEYIDRYGAPKLKKIVLPGMELNLVQFPLTQSRALMAREFGLASVLKNPAAQALAEKLLSQYSSATDVPLAEWDKVGLLDKLPDHEPVPPGVLKNIELNKQAADFTNLVWDQTTVDVVTTALRRIHDTNVLARQPNAYTLFEGEPGTTKSRGSRIIAALLDQPLYSLNAEQVSPENLQAKIVGETTVVGNPAFLAKELAYKGILSTPHARRELISLLETKRFEAFTPADWNSIAALEGLEKGTLYTMPGLAMQAKKYGGIYNIEELNCLRGDGFTLLTVNVLDVYDQDHPNFYVLSNMNPSNEKHHNRYALPVEISDRYGQPLRINKLDQAGITSVLRCNFTGMQPPVTINGTQTRVSPTTFGVAVSNSPSLKVLSSVIQSTSLEELAKRIAVFHKSMEDQIGTGALDKAASAQPRTQDFSILTRRGLSLFVQGMVSNILASQYRNFNPTTNLSAPPPAQLEAITAADVVKAIGSALQTYYVEPYSFQADKMRISYAMSGKSNSSVKPDEVVNTSVLINDLITRAKLNEPELRGIIQVIANVNKAKDELAARLEKDGNIPAPLAAAVANTPEAKSYLEFAGTATSSKPIGVKDLIVYSATHATAHATNKGSLMLVSPLMYSPAETKQQMPYLLPAASGAGLSSISSQVMNTFLEGKDFPKGFTRLPMTRMIKAHPLASQLADHLSSLQAAYPGLTIASLNNDYNPDETNTRASAVVYTSKAFLKDKPALADKALPLKPESDVLILPVYSGFDTPGDTPGTSITNNELFKGIALNNINYTALDMGAMEFSRERLQQLTKSLKKSDQALVYKQRPDLSDSPAPSI